MEQLLAPTLESVYFIRASQIDELLVAFYPVPLSGQPLVDELGRVPAVYRMEKYDESIHVLVLAESDLEYAHEAITRWLKASSPEDWWDMPHASRFLAELAFFGVLPFGTYVVEIDLQWTDEEKRNAAFM